MDQEFINQDKTIKKFTLKYLITTNIISFIIGIDFHFLLNH
jgi:hypothetical protein